VNNIEILDYESIQSKIYTVRGIQVMLDSDLARYYQVETKNLNKAVSRNAKRFPENFRFQLSKEEYEILRFQNGTLRFDSENKIIKNEWGKHSKYLPYVFTEQGVSMLSAVLRSDIAIEVSIKIIDSFVNMRKFLTQNGELFQRVNQIEKRQLAYEIKSDEQFDKIFQAIEEKSIKPKQGIFYNGQIFDAYTFISDLIKNTKQSLILLDNYIDESVLTLLSKNQNINITIYTHSITKQLKLDIDKYNSQYRSITLKKFDLSHDRFLIIDETDIYHIGASLKDLGKKWFAFSKMDKSSFDLIKRLNDADYSSFKAMGTQTALKMAKELEVKRDDNS
jgi:hypothetical protein